MRTLRKLLRLVPPSAVLVRGLSLFALAQLGRDCDSAVAQVARRRRIDGGGHQFNPRPRWHLVAAAVAACAAAVSRTAGAGADRRTRSAAAAAAASLPALLAQPLSQQLAEPLGRRLSLAEVDTSYVNLFFASVMPTVLRIAIASAGTALVLCVACTASTVDRPCCRCRLRCCWRGRSAHVPKDSQQNCRNCAVTFTRARRNRSKRLKCCRPMGSLASPKPRLTRLARAMSNVRSSSLGSVRG